MAKFKVDVKQAVAATGLELDAAAVLDPTVSLAVARNGVSMDQAANLGARVSLESAPYRHLGTVLAHTEYHVEVRDARNALKWAEDFSNMVTMAGLNKLVDATFASGLASPAWYVGLVDAAAEPVYDPGDTMASHPGWTESTIYSQSGRPAFTVGSVSEGSVDNTAARAEFSMTDTGTVAGCFLVDAASGGTGVLYGIGGFNGGSRPVEDGDTLRVAVTVSVTAAV